MSQLAELSENQNIASQVRNAGAAGFVFKHAAATDLVPAVEEALRGGTYVCPALQGLLPESFVQTYFSMGEHEIYLKDSMVEDPIAHVRFPKQAAATTLEWEGQKFYFVGAETRREFAEQNKIAIA
jgi:DNA-binding NarL/FixJ family response regulator